MIVGVLPPEFHFAPAEPAEFWTTLHATNPCDLRRSCHNMYGVGRLADGVTVQAAAAAMTSIARQLEEQYPDSNRGQGAAVLSLTEVIVGDIRPILLVLLTGAGLLLLIASVNVASLLLVRSESRKREIAVRRALGASAARVVRQFVTEGLVLVAAGSALGLASAYWAMQLLTSLIPANIAARMPFLHHLGLNAPVAAFRTGDRLCGSIAVRRDAPGAVYRCRRAAKAWPKAAAARRGRRGGDSAPDLSCSNWPSPWCCSSAPGCSAGASTICSMWISAFEPIA